MNARAVAAGSLSAATGTIAGITRQLPAARGVSASRPGSLPLNLADTLAAPSGPRNGGEMFRYRLHLEGGSDAGEATLLGDDPG